MINDPRSHLEVLRHFVATAQDPVVPVNHPGSSPSQSPSACDCQTFRLQLPIPTTSLLPMPYFAVEKNFEK